MISFKIKPIVVFRSVTGYLSLNEVKMFVLSLYFVSHVRGHVLQVAQDVAHALHVLLHFILPGVVGDPGVCRRKNQ